MGLVLFQRRYVFVLLVSYSVPDIVNTMAWNSDVVGVRTPPKIQVGVSTVRHPQKVKGEYETTSQ